jgi:hypothetical protein
VDQRTCVSPSSTSTLPRRKPGNLGHKPASLGPRPPLPRRTIPLTSRPLARELADQGWEQAA